MTDKLNGSASNRVLVAMPIGRVGSNLLMAYLGGYKPALRNTEQLSSLRSKHTQLDWLTEFYCPSDAGDYRLIFTKDSVRSMIDPLAVEALVARQDIAVIRMFRRDIVRMAISHIRAKQLAEKTAADTGQAQWGVRIGDQPLGATRIDIDELDTLITRHSDMTEKLSGLFLGCRHLDIEYEDMVADISRTMARVSDFLGIESREFASPFVKATPETFWDVIDNREELSDFLDRKGLSV